MTAKMLNTFFYKFCQDFKSNNTLDPQPIQQMLNNIFSARIIGNKVHGDLAELAMSAFINKNMAGYSSEHIGKELFRSKENEEDISITKGRETILVSMKAYGIGPLQLSTDKKSNYFSFLNDYLGKKGTTDTAKIKEIFESDNFSNFDKVNVFSLIYNEKKSECNIMIFDFKKARKNIKSIRYETKTNGIGKARKYPVYRFYDKDDMEIFEVRYGSTDANSLQRGLWTTTKSTKYFESLSNGWMNYSINTSFKETIAKLLLSSNPKYISTLKILNK